MILKKIIMKGTKGSETKALIRETAFKQFLTKDYSMVPLKDIEKSLNLSRGCTSYHYPTKQELFIDVINVYILDVQRVKHASDNLSGLSLFEYFNQYVDNIAKVTILFSATPILSAVFQPIK